jgi:enoyl-CoA hydratase
MTRQRTAPRASRTAQVAQPAKPADVADSADLAQAVRAERDGDVSIWTIDRPHVRNAFDFPTFDALLALVRRAAKDRALRAVVLTGAGGVFASGGDLRELRSANSRKDAERIADTGRAIVEGIASLRVPVIAALPGPAVGGGAELAVACDMRVADPRTRLTFKHARMGVGTAWGVLPKLVAMVGPGHASRLLLAGHEADAAEALRIGLVESVCDEGASLVTALAWAREVAKAAPSAIATLKALLRQVVEAPHARQKARERRDFLARWTSADHEEAVEAFFGSRPPKWPIR